MLDCDHQEAPRGQLAAQVRVAGASGSRAVREEDDRELGQSNVVRGLCWFLFCTRLRRTMERNVDFCADSVPTDKHGDAEGEEVFCGGTVHVSEPGVAFAVERGGFGYP